MDGMQMRCRHTNLTSSRDAQAPAGSNPSPQIRFPPQDVVRFLLKSGASPDAPDEAGITPAQLTKRDDISQALEEALDARRRAPPPPPPAA